MNPQWMQPWVWWVLLIVAPPVWFLFIVLRFFSEIFGAIAVIVMIIIGFWFIAALLPNQTTWVEARTEMPKPLKDWSTKIQDHLPAPGGPTSTEIFNGILKECSVNRDEWVRQFCRDTLVQERIKVSK